MFGILIRCTLLMAMLLVTACGGGGDSHNGGAGSATTAVAKLSAAGPTTPVAGLDVTISLPIGVTVKHNADGSVANGVITPSGTVDPASFLATATYTPLEGGSGGSLRIQLVSVKNNVGFAVGDYVSITCDILAGYQPTSSQFGVILNGAWDISSALITGLTPSITTDIR